MIARRVVKVGGSLFLRDDLPGRLHAWLRQQSPVHNVIISGGGIWADGVRTLDARYGLSTTAAHWMAIRAMSLNGRVLACSMDDVAYVHCFASLQDHLARRTRRDVVFDAMQFLQNIESHERGPKLPYGWQVTGDSIAARLARVLGASELVLLKATQVPESLAQACDLSIVDAHFPVAAEGIASVRCEQLP